MTDNEMLELAAKAAGIIAQYSDNCGDFSIGEPYYRNEVPWNPIYNDRDAFRLMVKLRIDVGEGVDKEPCAWVSYVIGDRLRSICEPYAEDPCAATRRAIVRAAAEIGKSIK